MQREISTLLAQSFFMKFSLTILAVLARIRVLVQQMLHDAVHVYNAVSSLSQKEQTVKLNQEGFEVFREYFPRKQEARIMLECSWQTDKYVLVERLYESETNCQEKDDQGDISLEPVKIQYQNIDVLLGADPIEAEESGTGSGLNNAENQASSGVLFEKLSRKLVEDGSCIAGTPDSKRDPGLATSCSASPLSCPAKLKNQTKKKVAFISVKPPPPPSTTNELRSGTKRDRRDEDPFFNLLVGGNKNIRTS